MDSEVFSPGSPAGTAFILTHWIFFPRVRNRNQAWTIPALSLQCRIQDSVLAVNCLLPPTPAYTPPPNSDQRPSGFSHWMSKQLKEYRHEFRLGVRASMMQAVLLFLSSFFFFFVDSVKISGASLSNTLNWLHDRELILFALLVTLHKLFFFFHCKMESKH